MIERPTGWRHAWLSLRSLVYFALMALTIGPWGFLVFLAWPLPFKARFYLAGWWTGFAVWLLKPICGLGYRVSGMEHIPEGESVVFLGKHQSTWETFAFQAIFPPFVWILKREAVWIPLVGWGLAALNSIAIDRKSGRASVTQIVEQGRQRLAQGLNVMVFPETTRVPAGTTRRFGMGGALLAAASGHRVVPIAHNAGVFWARRGFYKHPGTIDVVVGAPIETRGREAEAINAEAKAWIDAQTAALETRASA